MPLTKFICDAHCKSMLVQRFVGNKEEDEGGDAEGGEKERGQRAQSSGPPSISSSSSAMMSASSAARPGGSPAQAGRVSAESSLAELWAGDKLQTPRVCSSTP